VDAMLALSPETWPFGHALEDWFEAESEILPPFELRIKETNDALTVILRSRQQIKGAQDPVTSQNEHSSQSKRLRAPSLVPLQRSPAIVLQQRRPATLLL
jgi:hypothetical protein